MGTEPEELARKILATPTFQSKRNINLPAEAFADGAGGVRNGDDAAAIPDGDGYLLLAAEGIIPSLLDADPYLAGRSAVLANVNDIYAMGGRPVAMVDVVATENDETAKEICRGMKDNAARFDVPIVGGHTLKTVSGRSLAVAIVGRANKLITSFDARPGDRLLLAYNPNGVYLKETGFWNSTGQRADDRIRGDRELLPQAAEAGLTRAGKDVSFSGIAGTALMLAETSACGVTIDVDRLPPPPEGADIAGWLTSYFSYGFLLAVRDEQLAPLSALFSERGLWADAIGKCCEGSRVMLKKGDEETTLWDWAQSPYTGFGKR